MKTEVSHDEGSVLAFHRGLIFGRGKKPHVRASPNLRVPRGLCLPRGIPRFSCQDLPRRLNFSGLGFRIAIFSRAGAIGDLTILGTLTIKVIMAITAKGELGPWRERVKPKLTRSSQYCLPIW